MVTYELYTSSKDQAKCRLLCKIFSHSVGRDCLPLTRHSYCILLKMTVFYVTHWVEQSLEGQRQTFLNLCASRVWATVQCPLNVY